MLCSAPSCTVDQFPHSLVPHLQCEGLGHGDLWAFLAPELISFIKCLSVCLEVRGSLQELVLSPSPESTKDKTGHLCSIEPSPQARTVFCFDEGEGRGRKGRRMGEGALSSQEFGFCPCFLG